MSVRSNKNDPLSETTNKPSERPDFKHSLLVCRRCWATQCPCLSWLKSKHSNNPLIVLQQTSASELFSSLLMLMFCVGVLEPAGSPTFRQKTLWERLRMNEPVCLLRLSLRTGWWSLWRTTVWRRWFTGPTSPGRPSAGPGWVEETSARSSLQVRSQQTGSKVSCRRLKQEQRSTLDLDRADEVLVEYQGRYSACLFCQGADKII